MTVDQMEAEVLQLRALVAQLQAQQAAQTQAIKANLEGRFTGEDSQEAWLLALNPTLAGRLRPNPFGDGE